MGTNASESNSPGDELARRLRMLNGKQLQMIDEALYSIGDYGEVRLVVEKGRLRFIVTEKSFDVQKWIPGILANHEP